MADSNECDGINIERLPEGSPLGHAVGGNPLGFTKEIIDRTTLPDHCFAAQMDGADAAAEEPFTGINIQDADLSGDFC